VANERGTEGYSLIYERCDYSRADNYSDVLNSNLDIDIRDFHLHSLENKGLLNSTISGSGNVSVYWLTSDGLQLVATSDLDDTLDTTNTKLSNLNTELSETLSMTNERLSETNKRLERLRHSRRDSSAVQTPFIITIITLTYVQVRAAVLSGVPFWLSDGVYILLIVLGVGLGGQSLVNATRSKLSALIR
jgi:hypothetical protein